MLLNAMLLLKEVSLLSDADPLRAAGESAVVKGTWNVEEVVAGDERVDVITDSEKVVKASVS